MSAVPTTSLKSAGGNIVATGAVANGDAEGTIVAMDLKWDPRFTAEKRIILPTSESWIITDAYASSAADAGVETNPVIDIYKDNDRKLDSTQFLGNVIITSQQRPNGLHGNLMFEGGSHMSMNLITSAAAVANRNVKAVFPFEKLG